MAITCKTCGATDLYWKRVTERSQSRYVLYEPYDLLGVKGSAPHSCTDWEARHAPVNIVRNVSASGKLSVYVVHGETIEYAELRVRCESPEQVATEVEKLLMQYPGAHIIDRIVTPDA